MCHIVERIADLIAHAISPEPGRVNAPGEHLIEFPLSQSGAGTAPYAFEIDVFNFCWPTSSRSESARSGAVGTYASTVCSISMTDDASDSRLSIE